MPPAVFETKISAGERPQTYALDRAAAGTGTATCYSLKIRLCGTVHIFGPSTLPIVIVRLFEVAFVKL